MVKGFWAKGGGRNGCFLVLVCNLKSATLAWASWSTAPIFCFGKKIISHTTNVLLQIPTVKLWIFVLRTPRKQMKMIQRLTNLGWRFYGGRFWQKFENLQFQLSSTKLNITQHPHQEIHTRLIQAIP